MPRKTVWELQSCSNPRWQPLVLVVGGIVKVHVWDLELDPKLKQIARATTQQHSHIRTPVSITAV